MLISNLSNKPVLNWISTQLNVRPTSARLQPSMRHPHRCAFFSDGPPQLSHIALHIKNLLLDLNQILIGGGH